MPGRLFPDKKGICVNRLLLTATLGLLTLSGCGHQTETATKSETPPTRETDASASTVGTTPPAQEPSRRRAPVPTNIRSLATLPLTQDEIAAGWISLFDGESLYGWTANSDAPWRVEDGVIVCDGSMRGLLNTNFQFANFELRCDFRLQAGGNSGVFLRTEATPANPAVDCYELNICDTHDTFPTGSLVGRVKADKVPPTDGEWHSWHVTCDGPQVVARLDGTEVVHLEDAGEDSRASGHIGLQLNKGRIEFRNITLRPLGGQPLFDGKTLDGWREVPDSASRFEPLDGTIHVVNGPGFLETERVFGDFMLQASARTNALGLNSGIFFRAIRGTKEAPSNGYEMQINNAVLDEDPLQPMDWGTGAIFRRQAARRVNARDREWFTTLLIVQGPRMGTWVNGLQVVDWTDTRPADPNPRKGRRLEAGHISLQGHDPTTDLNFRSLVIFETTPGN